MSSPVPHANLAFEHVVRPGGSATTLLLLHATGGDERQLLGLGRQLAPDATLLSPRGQVLENGVTRRFFARHSALDLDVEDLLGRTDDLAAFVAEAAEAYALDPDRVIALGYSNGANIAVSLLLRRPRTLCGAALLRPTLPYEPDALPVLRGTAALIASGTRDRYVAPGKAERLAALLRAAGADLTVRTQPAGHELTDDDLRAVQTWLNHRTTEEQP